MDLLRFLDRVDERMAAADDGHKTVEPFCVGARHAFPHLDESATLDALTARVAEAVQNPARFYGVPQGHQPTPVYQGDQLAFKSAVATAFQANDTVHATVPPRPGRKRAVIILRHWNAGDRSYTSMATVLDRMGVTPVRVTLPFHGRRKPPERAIADYFLSANLGRTLAATRQAVVDVRCVIDWLESQGYEEFALIGASLGSCVASLVAIADVRIRASALLLTAGDFADVVWTGRATRHIRAALDGPLALQDLKAAWSIISPSSFIAKLGRRDHRLLLISATRDSVVQPRLTRAFADLLRSAGARFREHEIACGHYTLAVPPFSLLALSRMVSFFRAEAWR